MDTLSPLLSRFNPGASVFFSDRLCQNLGFDVPTGFGYIHVFREGQLTVTRPNTETLILTEPTVLFYPRPCQHHFQVDEKIGAKLVCASIEFGTGIANPILSGLPDVLCIPLANMKGIDMTLSLLFDEAFDQQPGRKSAIDRLIEYFLVQVLRHVMREKMVQPGVLATLAEPRLSKALSVMHEQPEHLWTLEELAQTAGMSRARFAVHFREAMGLTPLEYLTDWRISVAQYLLRRGLALKLIAPMVGYASNVALTRAFTRRLGIPPAQWLADKTAGKI